MVRAAPRVLIQQERIVQVAAGHAAVLPHVVGQRVRRTVQEDALAAVGGGGLDDPDVLTRLSGEEGVVEWGQCAVKAVKAVKAVS